MQGELFDAMTTSGLNKVLDYWNRQANGFEAIYTGLKPAWGRFLDRWLCKDTYQRYKLLYITYKR